MEYNSNTIVTVQPAPFAKAPAVLYRCCAATLLIIGRLAHKKESVMNCVRAHIRDRFLFMAELF